MLEHSRPLQRRPDRALRSGRDPDRRGALVRPAVRPGGRRGGGAPRRNLRCGDRRSRFDLRRDVGAPRPPAYRDRAGPHPGDGAGAGGRGGVPPPAPGDRLLPGAAPRPAAECGDHLPGRRQAPVRRARRPSRHGRRGARGADRPAAAGIHAGTGPARTIRGCEPGGRRAELLHRPDERPVELHPLLAGGREPQHLAAPRYRR